MTVTEEQEILQGIIPYLPARIANAVSRIAPSHTRLLEEIRVKAGLPLMGVFNGYDRFISGEGILSTAAQAGLPVAGCEVEELFYRMCEHSVYAYQEDIARGFITLRGGHRAGICGSVVYQGETVKTIKDISSVCIRISRQLKGCAGDVFLHILRGLQDIYNTLILSPPRCGKTTLLRDLCRMISEGRPDIGFQGLRSAVVDERSELAACYKGIPQNDLGPRTDILDACRKPEGIEMVLRGMSPSVIIVDELGSAGDAQSIRRAWNAGVRIVATAHAYDLEDFKRRLSVGSLAEDRGFERYIILGLRQGERIIRVMDQNGDQHYCTHEDTGLDYGLYGLHGNRDEDVLKASGEAACAGQAQ